MSPVATFGITTKPILWTIPGKKALHKRGMNYPERVMNFSKSSISVMFCGNAEGRILPPYMVYKAEHLWKRWCMGGLKGARFNRTKSGWFDSCTFQDWFKVTFLQTATKQEGKLCQYHRLDRLQLTEECIKRFTAVTGKSVAWCKDLLSWNPTYVLYTHLLKLITRQDTNVPMSRYDNRYLPYSLHQCISQAKQCWHCSVVSPSEHSTVCQLKH